MTKRASYEPGWKVTSLLIALASLAAGTGCSKKSDDAEPSGKDDKKAQQAKKKELPEPDFELKAEKLASAYADAPQATDKKYGGKTVRISGRISKISIYDDKAFVTMVGAFFKESTKLGEMRKEDGASETGVIDVSCATKAVTYVKFMKKTVDKASAIDVTKVPVGTIQGVYEKGYPLSKESPAVQINDCELIEPKEE